MASTYKQEGHKSIPTKYENLEQQGKYFTQTCCTQLSNKRTAFDIMEMNRTNPNKTSTNMAYPTTQHGLAHFRPDDPVYKPIGGIGKGINWL